MSFPLPSEFERAVLDRVASGQYASAKDVLRALVDALEEREAGEEKLEALRRDVRIGRDQLDRGESYSRDEVLARLQEARPGARLGDEAPENASRGLEVSIPAQWLDFVEDQILRGRFESPDMMVEAGLARLHGEFEDEQLTDEEREELRRELMLGLESAENEELIPGDEVVARMLTWLCDQDAREFVEQNMEAGKYSSVSELLTAAIRRLMEAEETDWNPEDLRRELKVGTDALARGEGVPVDEAAERMMRWREADDAA